MDVDGSAAAVSGLSTGTARWPFQEGMKKQTHDGGEGRAAVPLGRILKPGKALCMCLSVNVLIS